MIERPALRGIPLLVLANKNDLAGCMSEEDVINTIMLEPMPKKSFVKPEEIAGTVSYLVSPAARLMTGQTLVLDGGWTVK